MKRGAYKIVITLKRATSNNPLFSVVSFTTFLSPTQGNESKISNYSKYLPYSEVKYMNVTMLIYHFKHLLK